MCTGMSQSCYTILEDGYAGILESWKTGKWYYIDDVCGPVEISKIDGDIVDFVYPDDENPNIDYSVRLSSGEIVEIEWFSPNGGYDGDAWRENVESGIEDDPDYDRELEMWADEINHYNIIFGTPVFCGE